MAPPKYAPACHILPKGCLNQAQVRSLIIEHAKKEALHQNLQQFYKKKLRRDYFTKKNFICFFIDFDTNLTQTQILALKITPNYKSNSSLYPKKVNENRHINLPHFRFISFT